MIKINKENIPYIEITYSNKQYRPSKSLIDENLYINYVKTSSPINLFENFNSLHLKECLNYITVDNTVSDDNVKINKENYKLLCINDKDFIDNTKVNKINVSKNIVIILDNLHNYIKVQFLVYISSFFKESILIFSKFNTIAVAILTDRVSEIIIDINKKKYIRDLNIKVEKDLQSFIYSKNNYILEKLQNNCKIINLELSIGNIDEIYNQIELTNEYYLNYVTNNSKVSDCLCKSIYFNKFLKCYVCKKCYAMHYLDEDLVLDHSSAADLNPFL